MFKWFIFIYLWIPPCFLEGEYYRRDYTYIEDLQAFYKVHELRRPFQNSMTLCTAEGSKLFVPSSKNELDKVLTLTTNKMDYFWTGITDIIVEDEFLALYDIPINKVYWKWKGGEPNNLVYANNTYDEDCVVVDKDGLSYDVPCNNYFYPICKKELENFQRNEACENFDAEYKYIFDLDRCYKLHTTPQNWYNAFKFCKAEESYLTIINNKVEAQELKKLFAQYPEEDLNGNFNKDYIHLGFNDIINFGIYTTIKNELVYKSKYQEWAYNEPNTMEGVNHCGAMMRNGKLRIANCGAQAMFICEKELTGELAQPLNPIKKNKPPTPITTTQKYYRPWSKLPDE